MVAEDDKPAMVKYAAVGLVVGSSRQVYLLQGFKEAWQVYWRTHKFLGF